MTVHHCPKCDLAFALKAEVEDHCWHDHPEFRHEYPASTPHPRAAAHAAEAQPVAAAAAADSDATDEHAKRHHGLPRWLSPTREHH